MGLVLACTTVSAQTVADFEDFGLSVGTYLNNSQPAGAFSNGNISLPNSYFPDFDAWTGWAISATNDPTTPGYTNQYSAIAGEGANGSATYAVGYSFDGVVMHLSGNAAGGAVNGLWITNSTYTYLSMRDGDAFSKKFGGESGNDPDFFKLTVKKFLGGQLETDSIEFFLADYRFANNAEDYILDDWAYLDLSGLGAADSLLFFLRSTDNGAFGMNTPAYFCVDEVSTADGLTNVEDFSKASKWSVFPNPATECLSIQSGETGSHFQIVGLEGTVRQSGILMEPETKIDLTGLPSGIYVVNKSTTRGWSAIKFVKQ